MRVVRRVLALGLLIFCVTCLAVDIPHQPDKAIVPGDQPIYYWQSSPVGHTAQLLTLFCRSCQTAGDLQRDVPLVAVLRDTLGDATTENDRVSSVWLLTYSSPNIGRRILSGVPFFFWRAGEGASSVAPRDTKPLFDLTQPQHPVLSEAGRDLLQWTMFDPMTTTVRATSRAYRSNGLDYERVHLEEAASYLRAAPTSNDSSALTATQLDTVIARLELRKRLLGGLVTENRAAQLGEESGYEQERIRSRNWELLRQCADKTGLLFEPLDLAGTTGQYAMLWFPLNAPMTSSGTSLGPVWKLLNIHNPWTDDRLQPWQGMVYERSLNADGSLLPIGETGATQVKLVPLGLYSLNYPKLPLLLVDFRDKLHVRWHEMTQRSINEITAGIIGISHFTNWYYYVGADLYNFVTARHGGAADQAARLDSYSQFRVKLALDQHMDPELRKELQTRVNSLAVNPLEAAASQEIRAAQQRYERLQVQAEESAALTTRLDKQRRAELAAFGETNKSQILQEFFHAATFGLYSNRVKPNVANLSTLDRNRRFAYNLAFLDSLAEANTQPEVAYETSRIRASVNTLNSLLPDIQSPVVRSRAQAVLLRVRGLSQDQGLQSDCSLALASLRQADASLRPAESPGLATLPHSLPHALVAPVALDARK